MIAFVVVIACALFIAWFMQRARVGRRSRAAGGVRGGVGTRLASRPVRVAAGRAILGALAGMVLAGPVAAVVGAGAGGASDTVLKRRTARNRARIVDGQLPDMMRALAAALRSGRSIPQALEAARDDATAPLRSALDLAIGRSSVGATLDASLDAFAATAGTEDASLVVETLKIGRAAGANLPVILDVAVESLVERDRIVRDRAATASQAKMSAIVVGAMPLAFFAIVGSGAREQLRVLLGDPVGWALLAGGALLEASGAMWMRALLRPR